MPFWLGEAPARSAELSGAVSDVRQQLAERLRFQIKGLALPPSSIIAAMLEIAWVFAHDIQTANRTNDDA